MSTHSSQGRLFVVSAPSGAGKTSLVQALMDSMDQIGVAISHTTRARRPEETDGINYHFATEQQFRALIEEEAFLEWANVFENLYGTSTAAANLVMDEGKHLILEIDWQGAQQVREKIPRTESIFILPPSLETLRDRLESRAQDDEATVSKRTDAAIEEISHYQEFDYIVVNDDFDVALDELKAIVSGNAEHLLRANRLRDLAPLIEDLLR